MALISCGECSCLFLLPVLLALLTISNNEVYKFTGYENHPVVDCLFSNLLLIFFSIIPLILSICCCNGKKNSYGKKNSEIKIYKSNGIKIKRPILATVIIAIILEIVNLLHSIFSNKLSAKEHIFINDYILELLFIVIALKIISKDLIYIHQHISMVIILLLGIGFYVIEKIYNNDFELYNYIIIFVIIKQLFFGMCVVVIKHLTELKKFSFFKLLFIFGLTGLFIDLFVLIFSSRIACGDSLKEICSVRIYENKTDINDTIPISNMSNMSMLINNGTGNNNSTIPINDTINDTDVDGNFSYYLDNLTEFINDFKVNIENSDMKLLGSNLIYKIIGVIIVCVFVSLLQRLYPSYLYFTNIYLTIFSKAKEFLLKKNKDNNMFLICQIVISLIIFVLSLVFNETIELKCCGLSDYTKKNKLKRNDDDEKRKSDWISRKMGDADATVVEDGNNSLGDIGQGDNEEDDEESVATINKL